MPHGLLQGWLEEREYLESAIHSIEAAEPGAASASAAERLERYRRILAELNRLIRSRG